MSIATKVIESMTQMNEGMHKGVSFNLKNLQKTLTAVSSFDARTLLALALKNKDDEFRPEKITLSDVTLDVSKAQTVYAEYAVTVIERGEHVRASCTVTFDVKKGEAVSYEVTS